MIGHIYRKVMLKSWEKHNAPEALNSGGQKWTSKNKDVYTLHSTVKSDHINKGIQSWNVRQIDKLSSRDGSKASYIESFYLKYRQ